jgi:hypothetical protein
MDVSNRLDNDDFSYIRDRYREKGLTFTDDVIRDHLHTYGRDRISAALARFTLYDDGSINSRESYFLSILRNIDDNSAAAEPLEKEEDSNLQKDLKRIRQKIIDLCKDNNPILVYILMQHNLLKNFRKARKHESTAQLAHLYRLEWYFEGIIHDITGLDITGEHYTLVEKLEELLREALKWMGSGKRKDKSMN